MVIWSNPAKESLKRIDGFVSEDSSFYAKPLADTVIAKTDFLSDFSKTDCDVSGIGNPDISGYSLSPLILYGKNENIEVFHRIQWISSILAGHYL